MTEQPETATVKCLVWDLDNTLWRGTLLEDGEVHLDDSIRQVIRTLDSRGILQSVASRNNHDEAWARLDKLGVAEYFVLPQIGWGRKSDAVAHIADTLKFAQHTVAFIDDQPTERAEVTYHLPRVRCYPAEQALELPELPEFSPPVVTVDARRRRQMYQAGELREAERVSFAGPDEEFLRSLELQMHIDRATGEDISRLEELTLRTSQMNATGVHYSEQTLRALTVDPDHDVLVISMTDRFGTHGAVGVLLLARQPRYWRLKLLATSCRVVAFGAGAAILRWLIDQAAHAHVHLVADFRHTERNRMMEIAYRFAGFTSYDCDCADPEKADADPARVDADSTGIERLHLTPSPQGPPSTLTVTAVELSGGDARAQPWTRCHA